MNKFKLIILTAVILLPVITVSESYAQERNLMETVRDQKQTNRESATQRSLELKKTNSYREIDRRVKSLESLSARIQNIRHISASQKTTLTNQIQTEINNLKALRSKIESDTNLDTLKEDRQSIVQSHRIYALFLPKITILVHADKIQNLIDLMRSKTDNADVIAKLTEADTKTKSAIAKVVDLNPDGYPENKTLLKEAKELLESARKDLNSSYQMIKAASPK